MSQERGQEEEGEWGLMLGGRLEEGGQPVVRGGQGVPKNVKARKKPKRKSVVWQERGWQFTISTTRVALKASTHFVHLDSGS